MNKSIAINLFRPASEFFDEEGYLAANPDVEAHVRRGGFSSGLQHFNEFGKNEPHRRVLLVDDLAELRLQKLQRIAPLLRKNMLYQWTNCKPNFLTTELREQAHDDDKDNVSANPYDPRITEEIENHPENIFLDCGAGLREIYYSNVVNFEIADVASTDVVGVGEELPFIDDAFDGVISATVLEHVRNPFRCADELVRVLKPSGQLFCTVPFLQPLHGFPHHYYNMTHQGVRALFEKKIDIKCHEVPSYLLPVVTLNWIIKSWAEGLDEPTKNRFLSLPLKEFIVDWQMLLDRDYVRNLSDEKNFELACGTYLSGNKRDTV